MSTALSRLQRGESKGQALVPLVGGGSLLLFVILKKLGAFGVSRAEVLGFVSSSPGVTEESKAKVSGAGRLS